MGEIGKPVNASRRCCAFGRELVNRVTCFSNLVETLLQPAREEVALGAGRNAMSRDAWKRLAAAPIAALLKRHGFRKSGLNFTLRGSRVALLVGLQSSTGSGQDGLKITGNVAIQLNDLVDRPSGVWDAHWRERIGFFMPDPRDHWWICRSDEDATRAGNEMADLLESRALPEMEKLASPEAMAALWASGRSPGLTDQQRVEYLGQLATAGIRVTR